MKRGYFFIIIPLLVSLFIYLFYRTEKTVINEIVIRIISFHHYFALREAVTGFLPLNELIIYSLPEGLWVFCITLTSKPFYVQLYSRKIYGVFIPLIFCIVLEVFQLLNFTKGRFDFFDIWISIVFWIIAHYFINYNSGRQNIIKPVNTRCVVCLFSYGIVFLSYVLE